MPSKPSSEDEKALAELLAQEICDLEARPDFVHGGWRTLKSQLAATRATDLAGVAAKLRVVLASVDCDACRLDVDILRSAIADLEYQSGID